MSIIVKIALSACLTCITGLLISTFGSAEPKQPRITNVGAVLVVLAFFTMVFCGFAAIWTM